MSPTTPHPPDTALHGRLILVPASPGISFAIAVRREILRHSPTKLLIQLPAPLKTEVDQCLAALPEIKLVVWRTPESSTLRMLAADPADPRIEAARLAREHGIPCEFIDTIEAGDGEPYQPLPDDQAVEQIGFHAYFDQVFRSLPPHAITARERDIAARTIRSAGNYGKTVVVLYYLNYQNIRALLEETIDAPPAPAVDPPVSRVLPVQPTHLPQLLAEMPGLTWLYEQHRRKSVPALDLLRRLLKNAAKQYGSEFDEEVNLTQWRALYQFGRNLAILRGRLSPGLYELITAARSCVDDDFGAIALEQALKYPPNEKHASSDEDQSRRRSHHLYFDLGEGLQRAEHAYPFPPLGDLEFNFKRRRPNPVEKSAWQRQFMDRFGESMCSWPPEDERIESFFDFLRKRALAVISADHTTVEEFSSSMLDGLDFRETTRNWHRGKIYVRRERRPPGKVGPVVLVWRDFPIFAHGLWRTTFYAENQNESDISFYASPLGRDMVGPMISRTEYHGILSIYPARGIPELWAIPQLFQWRTCARLLLASAILLCEEKYVAWVAPHPPAPDLVDFARARGIAIIHLPLASFSRKTLKKLRQVHVLGSRTARSWADDYIQE